MVTAEPYVIFSPGQWRRQILAHRDPQSIVARAGFVAASFIDRGNNSSAFVEIERVRAVLLFEEFGVDHARPEHVPLRLVSYGASRVPHGVRWGGEANSQLFKDLTLTPQFGACGQRIDRRKLELLSLAGKINCRRIAYGLALYPLDWVSDQLERATSIFAELRPNVQRQVFSVKQMFMT